MFYPLFGLIRFRASCTVLGLFYRKYIHKFRLAIYQCHFHKLHMLRAAPCCKSELPQRLIWLIRCPANPEHRRAFGRSVYQS